MEKKFIACNNNTTRDHSYLMLIECEVLGRARCENREVNRDQITE